MQPFDVHPLTHTLVSTLSIGLSIFFSKVISELHLSEDVWPSG